MRTSLQGISNKARRKEKYRFRNLYGCLNPVFLLQSFQLLNKKSASGIDKVSAKEYIKNLRQNIHNLVESLKMKRYKANLIRRVEIPKGNGKTRPLGIPTTSDKVLQMAVSRILTAIYEADFMDFSYGYRPNRGSKDAIKCLDKMLYRGDFKYVVDADIKGFFDNIDHDWMIRMLEERVNDRPFLRLIKKWLKAGILHKDGKLIHPQTGTPQGGIVSPILANIYLHYALDLWFEKVVKRNCNGKVYMVRYADDFVCLFEKEEDAQRFYNDLTVRLKKFNLELSTEKSKLIDFSKYSNNAGTFDFLGFEFKWGFSRKGNRTLKIQTSRKKLKKSKQTVKEWLRKNRHLKVEILIRRLNKKLRGYYNYYGISGNYKRIREFFRYVVRRMLYTLRKRSQRHRLTWERYLNLIDKYDLMKPRITEKKNLQLHFSFYSSG